MSWAARRRAMIAGGIGLVALIIVTIILIHVFSAAPTCSDKVQNQGEAGVDCGGPCALMCTGTASAPVVRFAQAVAPSPGLSDIIAYVDNPNATAEAFNVPYTVTLYGPDRVIVGTITGNSINLAPGATTPIFIPNLVAGKQSIAQVFISIDPSAITWYRATDTRLLPAIGSPTLSGNKLMPRVSAVLTDPSTTPIKNLTVVVAVFDPAGNVIDASSTLVPTIAGQGSATASFSWNAPFSGPVGRIDILPVVPPVPVTP